jgi:hypothetical protein
MIWLTPYISLCKDTTDILSLYKKQTPVVRPNEMPQPQEQADLLFLRHDQGCKYLLVCVDVMTQQDK